MPHDQKKVEPESSKPKISFGFITQKKTIEEPKIAPKRMKLIHFENEIATGHEEETVMMKKKKTDYIIPMIVRNDWRIERLRKMEEDGTITEEDRAKLAILVEAQGEAQIVAEEKTFARQVIVYNPEEIEAPEDADYSQIPIEEFGLAILRGCGWKEGEGIGKTNKKVVPLTLPKLRPSGLGLGAQLSKIQPKKDSHGGYMTDHNQGYEDRVSSGGVGSSCCSSLGYEKSPQQQDFRRGGRENLVARRRGGFSGGYEQESYGREGGSSYHGSRDGRGSYSSRKQ